MNRRVAIMVLVAFGGVFAARAEPILVVTEGTNAQRVTTGAHVYLVDSQTGSQSAGFLVSEGDWGGDWTESHDATRLLGTGMLNTVGGRNAESSSRFPIQVNLAPLSVETLSNAEPLELVAAVAARSDKPDVETVGKIYRDAGRGLLA